MSHTEQISIPLPTFKARPQKRHRSIIGEKAIQCSLLERQGTQRRVRYVELPSASDWRQMIVYRSLGDSAPQAANFFLINFI